MQSGPQILTLMCKMVQYLWLGHVLLLMGWRDLHLRYEIWSCFESTKCGHRCPICDYPGQRVSIFCICLDCNCESFGTRLPLYMFLAWRKTQGYKWGKHLWIVMSVWDCCIWKWVLISWCLCLQVVPPSNLGEWSHLQVEGTRRCKVASWLTAQRRMLLKNLWKSSQMLTFCSWPVRIVDGIWKKEEVLM